MDHQLKWVFTFRNDGMIIFSSMGEEFWQERRLHVTILCLSVRCFLDISRCNIKLSNISKMRIRTQNLQPYKRLCNQCAIDNGLHCTDQRKRPGARPLPLTPALGHSSCCSPAPASPADSPTGLAYCVLNIDVSQLQYHIVSPFSVNHWIWNKSIAIKNGHDDGMMTFMKISRIGIINYLQKHIEKDVKEHISSREGSEI